MECSHDIDYFIDKAQDAENDENDDRAEKCRLTDGDCFYHDSK